MQRRHAIIAVIALVALVLIPAAALASGFGGGFGHRGTPLGPKNLTHADGAWAGNATALNWTAGNCTGAGDCARNATHPDWTRSDGPGNRTPHGNATCAANLSCGRDRGAPGDFGNVTSPACDQDRPRFGNRTAANWTGTQESGRALGPRGRGGRGIGR